MLGAAYPTNRDAFDDGIVPGTLKLCQLEATSFGGSLINPHVIGQTLLIFGTFSGLSSMMYDLSFILAPLLLRYQSLAPERFR